MKTIPLKYWWTSSEEFPLGLPNETDVESVGNRIGINIREQRLKSKLPNYDFSCSSSMTDAEKSLIRDRDYLVGEFIKAESKGETQFKKWKKENRFFYIPSILLPEDPSVKLAKGNKKGYVSYCMYLAPSKESGFANVCSDSSEQCETGCLNTAGKGGFDANVIYARYNKTLLFKYHKKWFYDKLYLEIQDIVRKHNSPKNKEYGVPYCIRLNGTSDILWENIRVFEGKKNIFECFPSTQFYDYTKVLKRTEYHMPKNYDLTLSRSEKQANQIVCAEAIAKGWRIAVVFNRGKERYHFEFVDGHRTKVSDGFEYNFPKTWHGYKVIDGDETDLRFLDPNGVVVGLSIKGNEQKKADKENKKLFFVSPDKDGSYRSAERATIFGYNGIENINTEYMTRLKKGSKAAKDYMAKLRAMKSDSSHASLQGLDFVNKRGSTTYLHYSRKPKSGVRKKAAPKKAAARKTSTQKNTLLPLSYLLLDDTYTLGKSGKTIYQLGYKVPNRNAYYAYTLTGKRVIHKGTTKVNLIDERGISGYVHTKKRGTKTIVKYSRVNGVETKSKSHSDYNSPEVNIQIGLTKDSMNTIAHHMGVLAASNANLLKLKTQLAFAATASDKARIRRHIESVKDHIRNTKKQIQLAKKSIK